MSPPVPGFEVFQRETKKYLLKFRSPSLVDKDTASATYNPFGFLDLTSHTVHYRWKRKIADKDPALIAKTTPLASGIEILTQDPLPWAEGSTLGIARVTLIPDDTDPTVDSRMTAGRYFFDAWVVRPGGEQKISIRPTGIQLLEAVTDL